MEFIAGILVGLAAAMLLYSFTRPKEEVFDEETLEKVRGALADAGIPKDLQTVAIENILDSGVKFREKV